MTSDFHTPRPYIHIAFLASSLKKEADETLFLELALRGYNLSGLLREKEDIDDNAGATAEIVQNRLTTLRHLTKPPKEKNND